MNQRGTILLYALVGLAIIASLGYIGKRIYDAGGDSVRLEWEKATAQQRKDEAEKMIAASIGLEAGNAKAKVVYRTITQIVDKIIDRPVYRNVCLDDDGLSNANAALSGALTPASKPDKPLPKPDASS